MAKEPSLRPTAAHVLTFCQTQLSVAEAADEGVLVSTNVCVDFPCTAARSGCRDLAQILEELRMIGEYVRVCVRVCLSAVFMVGAQWCSSNGGSQQCASVGRCLTDRGECTDLT